MKLLDVPKIMSKIKTNQPKRIRERLRKMNERTLRFYQAHKFRQNMNK